MANQKQKKIVTILTLAAGVYVSIFMPGATVSSDHNQSEVARTGLETMRRMVGDGYAWQETIKTEYYKLFPDQLRINQPGAYIYSDNFYGWDSSALQTYSQEIAKN